MVCATEVYEDQNSSSNSFTDIANFKNYKLVIFYNSTFKRLNFQFQILNFKLTK